MKIITSNDDDFLYQQLLRLLYQIKLVQGTTSLQSTLRRHTSLKIYLIQKQIDRIKEIEEKYFTSDGLNYTVIQFENKKQSLQK